MAQSMGTAGAETVERRLARFVRRTVTRIQTWAVGPFFVYGEAMRRASTKIYQLLEPVIVGMGYELVGIEFSGGPRGGLLRIYIDRPEGIDVDDCQQVSYQVSGVLDVEDPIPGHYTLEVSSPGLDRPLFDRSHYERFAGRRVKVRTTIPHDGRRKFEGLLQGLEDDCVVLVLDGEVVRLPLVEVEQARLVPEF